MGMPRKPKKTTGTKRRGRAAVARRKKKAGSVLVPARKPRGAALAEALAPIFERLQFLDESVRNLWQMRHQMNALSKEIGDVKALFARCLDYNDANDRQIETLSRMADELRKDFFDVVDALRARVDAGDAQTRRMIEDLAVNTFDKIQEIKDAK